MSIQPQLENVDYLLNPHRKDLSRAHISKLENLLNKFNSIKGEDRANALYKMGNINVYLNRFDLAADCYLQSYNLDLDDRKYKNYLLSLRILGKIEESINEGLSFLQKNPHNIHILHNLLRASAEYLLSDVHMQNIRSYIDMHNGSTYQALLQLFQSIEVRRSQIIDTGISIQILNKVFNLIDREFRQVFSFTPTLSFNFSEDNSFLISLTNLPEYEDILEFNNRYEALIEKAIKDGEIDFDEYVDSLSKLVIGFRANPTQEVALK